MSNNKTQMLCLYFQLQKSASQLKIRQHK